MRPIFKFGPHKLNRHGFNFVLTMISISPLQFLTYFNAALSSKIWMENEQVANGLMMWRVAWQCGLWDPLIYIFSILKNLKSLLSSCTLWSSSSQLAFFWRTSVTFNDWIYLSCRYRRDTQPCKKSSPLDIVKYTIDIRLCWK